MREEAIKLLVAIYIEVNSVVPEKERITPAALKMEEQMFNRAVNALYAESLISGVAIKIGDEDDKPPEVKIADVLLTRQGAGFLEGYLGIDSTLRKLEKLRRVREKCVELGWDEMVLWSDKAISQSS